MWGYSVLVAIHLCDCFKAGAPGGSAFSPFKAEECLTGVLFWLSKRALMTVALQNLGIKGWSWLMRVLLASSCYHYSRIRVKRRDDGPQCFSARLLCPCTSSMAFKYSTNEQPLVMGWGLIYPKWTVIIFCSSV